MKLKEQAVAEMAKEKQAEAQGDPCREEKALSAEAELEEVNETFEGEMDNFQTPLVSGPSAPVRSFLRNLLSLYATACFCAPSAQQSRSLGTSPLFHSFKLPLFDGG
jgi:hypothetical protein